jgi:hypothetical protein
MASPADQAAANEAAEHLRYIKSQTNDANQIGAAQENFNRARARLGSPAPQPENWIQRVNDWVKP